MSNNHYLWLECLGKIQFQSGLSVDKENGQHLIITHTETSSITQKPAWSSHLLTRLRSSLKLINLSSYHWRWTEGQKRNMIKKRHLLSWILNYIPIRDSARAVMFTFVLNSGFPFLRNSKYWKLTQKAILKCAHQQLCVCAMHIMWIIHEYWGSREPDSLSRIHTQRRQHWQVEFSLPHYSKQHLLFLFSFHIHFFVFAFIPGSLANFWLKCCLSIRKYIENKNGFWYTQEWYFTMNTLSVCYLDWAHSILLVYTKYEWIVGQTYFNFILRLYEIT